MEELEVQPLALALELLAGEAEEQRKSPTQAEVMEEEPWEEEAEVLEEHWAVLDQRD